MGGRDGRDVFFWCVLVVFWGGGMLGYGVASVRAGSRRVSVDFTANVASGGQVEVSHGE